MQNLTISLQAFVAAAIFFVWVVRYQNIIVEFKHFGLPDWLRDSVGTLKLGLSVLLLVGIERPEIAVIGGWGVAVLMACAFATHVRAKNPIYKMLPSLSLLTLSLLIVFLNHRLLGSSEVSCNNFPARAFACIVVP